MQRPCLLRCVRASARPLSTALREAHTALQTPLFSAERASRRGGRAEVGKGGNSEHLRSRAACSIVPMICAHHERTQNQSGGPHLSHTDMRFCSTGSPHPPHLPSHWPRYFSKVVQPEPDQAWPNLIEDFHVAGHQYWPKTVCVCVCVCFVGVVWGG
jgi:hypothetical protein